jgi:hypothetical protein
MSARPGVTELCARTLAMHAPLLTGDCAHDLFRSSLSYLRTIVAGGCHGVV